MGEIAKELEIPCNVGGSPDPSITWYRDSEPLENIGAVRYNILENGSLLINYMRREDSGMFQCSVQNSAGYTTGYTWLRVKSKFRLDMLRERASYDLLCFCWNLNGTPRTLNYIKYTL